MCSDFFHRIIDHDVCIMNMKLCIVKNIVNPYVPMRSSPSHSLHLCALPIEEYRKQVLKGNITLDDRSAARAGFAGLYSTLSTTESRMPLLKYKSLIDQTIRDNLEQYFIGRITYF